MKINVLNAAGLDKFTSGELSLSINKIFNVDTKVDNLFLSFTKAFHTQRNQYNSTKLIAEFLQLYQPDLSSKNIIIVNVDLFVPVLTFVFGEAQLDGTTAIVSTHRFSNVVYGLPDSDFTQFRRLEKEVIHELCHTFGLVHCHHLDCVMRPSTCVEEIDLKKEVPCNQCYEYLNTVIRSLQ